MRISDLKGKKIAVWGLGTEGVQAVRYLTAKEITDKIVLFNDTEAEKPECCRPFELICGEKIGRFSRPGGSDHSFARSEHLPGRTGGSQTARIVVTSVTDLCLNEFLSRPGCRVIGVSGSKGKSTSVSVLAYILRETGHKAALGGQYRPADD